MVAVLFSVKSRADRDDLSASEARIRMSMLSDVWVADSLSTTVRENDNTVSTATSGAIKLTVVSFSLIRFTGLPFI